MQKTFIFLTLSFVLFALVSCNETAPKNTPATSPKKATVVIADTLKVDTVEKEVAIKPIEEERHRYFLIKESFEKKENAEALCVKLKAEGLNAHIIERPKGPNAAFFKVAYKSFPSREMAVSALRLETKKEGFEQVWILIQR